MSKQLAGRSEVRTLAIVLELENFESWMERRVLDNLNELQRQVENITDLVATPVALKVVYDSNIFSKQDAERFAKSAGIDQNPMFRLASIGAPNIHYYQHKDVGAAQCEQDIVLLMDCDLSIQDGWLRNLVGALDENVHFVCGRTLIETDGFMAKVYALTTSGFLLMDEQHTDLVPHASIMANAFAYQRSRVAGPIFPVVDAYRSHCALATKRLISLGETIYQHRGAIAYHPSETDLPSYLSRAFSEGRDRIVLARFCARPGFRGWADRSLPGSLVRLSENVARLAGRSMTQYQRVGLPLLAAPLVLGLGTLYYSVSFLAELVTLLNDRLARRWSLVKS